MIIRMRCQELKSLLRKLRIENGVWGMGRMALKGAETLVV